MLATIYNIVKIVVPQLSKVNKDDQQNNDENLPGPQEKSNGHSSGSGTEDNFDREREQGRGRVTAFDPDRGLGFIDGKIRFSTGDLPKLPVPPRIGLQLEYKARHSFHRSEWEVMEWKVSDAPVAKEGTQTKNQNLQLNSASPSSSLKTQENESIKLNTNQSTRLVSQPKKEEKTVEMEPGKLLCYKKLSLQVIRTGQKFFVVRQSDRSKSLKVDPAIFPDSHLLLTGDWVDIVLEYEDSHQVNILNVQEDDTPVAAQWTQHGCVMGTVTTTAGVFSVNNEIYCPEKPLMKANLGVGDRCKVTYVLSDQIVKLPQNNTDDDGYDSEVNGSVWKFSKRILRIEKASEIDEKMDFEDRNILNQHTDLDNLCKGKRNVDISPDHLNFGAKKIGTVVESKFEIRNNDPSRRAILESVSLRNDQSVCQFTVYTSSSIMVVEPQSTISVTIKCIPKLLGRTQEICIFDFGQFKIGRKVSVWSRPDDPQDFPTTTTSINGHTSDLGSRQDARRRKEQQLKEDKERLMRLLHDSTDRVIRGPNPVRGPFFSDKAANIRGYDIPRDIVHIYVEHQISQQIHGGGGGDGITQLVSQKFPNVDWLTLNFKNYVERFHTAIHLEELEHNKLCKHLDLKSVQIAIKPGSDHLVIIPVSTESLEYGRFPLTVGDRLRCSYTKDDSDDDPIQPPIDDDPNKMAPVDDEAGNIKGSSSSSEEEEEEGSPAKIRTWWEGYIFEIGSGQVFAKFNQDFVKSHDPRRTMNVNFQQKRATFRRNCHSVVLGKEFLNENWLFPTEETAEVKEPKIQYLEKEENEQVTTVPQVEEPENVNLAPVRYRKLLEQEQRKLADIRAYSVFRHDATITDAGPVTGVTLTWFNRTLNAQQKDAVRRVLRGQCRPLPYIIFGPPGTGKSVTLVEAMMQVHKLDPQSRILVTAPSNQAADLIADRLVNSGQYCPGDFVRLNGFMRSAQTVPMSIRNFSVIGENLQAIINHRMVICTLSSAAQFFQLRLNPQHFTHVFIDEGCYCTEPETLIACVMSAVSENGQIIMAGDPNQLQPVLYHNSQVHRILRRSLLERFMTTSSVYAPNLEKFPMDMYNPVFITMLTKSYRLSPALVTLPSSRFYHGHLKSGNDTDEELLTKIGEKEDGGFLPSKKIPFLFHGLQSQSVKEEVTKSWFNVDEARQCCQYVQKLREAGVKCEDIGIISLYRKQVEVIRDMLTGTLGVNEEGEVADKKLPTVATIQHFQGGERRIIIISTVISSVRGAAVGPSLPSGGVKLRGFLYSSKMFNVTITRAKSLLIVIGDPNSLQHSTDWLALLRYSIDLGVYFGCNLPLGVKVDDEKIEVGTEIIPTAAAAQQQQQQHSDDVLFTGEENGDNRDTTNESDIFRPFD